MEWNNEIISMKATIIPKEKLAKNMSRKFLSLYSYGEFKK